MNFRANKPFLVRLRRVWYYCCCGFVPAFAGKVAERYYADAGKGAASIEHTGPSLPYLTVIGSPPLRFQEPPPAVSPLEETPTAKLPKPITSPESDARRPAGPPPPPASTAPSPQAPRPAQPAGATTLSAGQPSGQDTAQPSIIPDEMRPRVRPEEFLPFFQLPVTGPTETPAPVPPSSATYRQE
jgi:hypothetical protein